MRSGVWVGCGGSGPYDMALGVCENLLCTTCRPVIAISVVPKLVTTHAVWMPGLWRCPGTVWASGGLIGRRLTSTTRDVASLGPDHIGDAPPPIISINNFLQYPAKFLLSANKISKELPVYS